MGDMPLMTMNGTFVINGTERVIVSRCIARQACSSPRPRQEYCPAAVVRRAHHLSGSWFDFEFDAKDIVYVRAPTGAASCR
jgi:DNA-directed RNA polymerase subunit beta